MSETGSAPWVEHMTDFDGVYIIYYNTLHIFSQYLRNIQCAPRTWTQTKKTEQKPSQTYVYIYIYINMYQSLKPSSWEVVVEFHRQQPRAQLAVESPPQQPLTINVS